jgi:hypothetical protein
MMMKWKNQVSHQAWIIFVFVAFLELLFLNPAYGDTPEISSVEPYSGVSDREINIAIKGSNFESGAKVALYGGGPFVKGSVPMPADANNVFISGDFAYVAASGYLSGGVLYDSGLYAIDISDPENATIVAYCPLPGGVAKDVFVSGGYAYVAASRIGLQIIDITSVISNPPEVLELTVDGSYDTPYSAEGIYISGNYAYVADGDSLQIIDITNPATPVKVDGYNTSGIAYGVSVAGDYAYVADGYSGLQILDVSNPADTQPIGTYPTPGTAYRVAVKGDYAYVADYDGGLQVINIKDPATPILAGSCDKISYAEDVYVNGNYAYVAGSGAGFTIVDISSPENPVLVNNCDTISGYGIHFSGKTAYMTTASGLSIIDVSILDNPSIISVYDALESATAVHVLGNLAYAVSSVSGLQVINITDPANPSFVGYCPILDAAVQNIHVAGNYAYVADGVNGLRVINIFNPAKPDIVGTCDTLGTAYDVHVVDDYAYVADDSEGLHVIDISNPADPNIVGSVKSTQPSNSFRAVHAAGNYAYVVDYWTGVLYKINVFLPESPNISGWCELLNYGNDVFVAGDYAYVAAGGSGLEVISIAGPTVVGSTDTPGSAERVAVSGNYAYVATGYAGIQVVDVSSAVNPLLVGACNTPGSARDVHVTDSNVFAADGAMGLQIIEPFAQCTNVSFIDSETISATIPAGYSAGGYNLHLVNPGGETDILYNGFMFPSTTPLTGPLFLLLSDN